MLLAVFTETKLTQTGGPTLNDPEERRLESEPHVLDCHELFAQRFRGQGDIDGR
jgi:hypothetical protein